jgi:hypothetical protein
MLPTDRDLINLDEQSLSILCLIDRLYDWTFAASSRHDQQRRIQAATAFLAVAGTASG